MARLTLTVSPGWEVTQKGIMEVEGRRKSRTTEVQILLFSLWPLQYIFNPMRLLRRDFSFSEEEKSELKSMSLK